MEVGMRSEAHRQARLPGEPRKEKCLVVVDKGFLGIHAGEEENRDIHAEEEENRGIPVEEENQDILARKQVDNRCCCYCCCYKDLDT